LNFWAGTRKKSKKEGKKKEKEGKKEEDHPILPSATV